jgi:hypothetical protein
LKEKQQRWLTCNFMGGERKEGKKIKVYWQQIRPSLETHAAPHRKRTWWPFQRHNIMILLNARRRCTCWQEWAGTSHVSSNVVHGRQPFGFFLFSQVTNCLSANFIITKKKKTIMKSPKSPLSLGLIFFY